MRRSAAWARPTADVRSVPDGTLHLMRESYRTETAWAPRYVTSALRQVRMGAEDARWRPFDGTPCARQNDSAATRTRPP